MRNSSRLQLGIAVVAAAVSTATLARATTGTCAVSNPSAIAQLGTYDPFGASGIPSGPFNITLHRNAQTAAVDLVFYIPSSQSGFDIKAGGVSVVTHSLNPNLDPVSPPTGTLSAINWDANGNAVVALTGVVPAGLDQPSGTNNVTYDIHYDCKGTPGNGSVNNQTLNDALTTNYTVQSALQASYTGSPLDFGDVSNLNNGQANNRQVSGNVRVASSGPFSIAVTAGSGQSWAMTYPGGSSASANQRIYYRVSFLGQKGSHNGSEKTFSTVTCRRVGISGQNLPISASLNEATSGKDTAPDYSDYLSVTVTPLAVDGPQKNCAALANGDN